MANTVLKGTDGAWTLSDNKDLQITTTNSEYLQIKLRDKLRLIAGEWYLNTTKGIDYFGKIFLKNPNLDDIADAFKLAINNTPGVEELTFFRLELLPETRNLKINFSVQTTDGAITIQEVI